MLEPIFDGSRWYTTVLCSKIQSTVRWKHNLFPMHSSIMSCMFARCGNAAIQEVAPKNVAMLGLQQLIGPSLTEHLP